MTAAKRSRLFYSVVRCHGHAMRRCDECAGWICGRPGHPPHLCERNVWAEALREFAAFVDILGWGARDAS